MVDLEADDALAAGAAAAARDERVEQVLICTPDKDLAQCVRGTRVVQMNLRTRKVRDEPAVVEQFGVRPHSIPDYLAPRRRCGRRVSRAAWMGPRSAAAVLSRFEHLEAIPDAVHDWHVNVAQAGTLAATLKRERRRVLLFRELATLRDDVTLFESVDQLRWEGPSSAFAAAAAVLDGKAS